MAQAKQSRKTVESKPSSIEELRASLQTKQVDLIEAKRSHAAGELVNPRVLGAYRKDIARLLTAINNFKANDKEAK